MPQTSTHNPSSFRQHVLAVLAMVGTRRHSLECKGFIANYLLVRYSHGSYAAQDWHSVYLEGGQLLDNALRRRKDAGAYGTTFVEMFGPEMARPRYLAYLLMRLFWNAGGVAGNPSAQLVACEEPVLYPMALAMVEAMPVTREMQSNGMGHDAHRHTEGEGRHSEPIRTRACRNVGWWWWRCVCVRVGRRVEGGRRSGLRSRMSTASHQNTASNARVNHVEANY